MDKWFILKLFLKHLKSNQNLKKIDIEEKKYKDLWKINKHKFKILIKNKVNYLEWQNL